MSYNYNFGANGEERSFNLSQYAPVDPAENIPFVFGSYSQSGSDNNASTSDLNTSENPSEAHVPNYNSYVAPTYTPTPIDSASTSVQTTSGSPKISKSNRDVATHSGSSDAHSASTKNIKEKLKTLLPSGEKIPNDRMEMVKLLLEQKRKVDDGIRELVQGDPKLISVKREIIDESYSSSPSASSASHCPHEKDDDAPQSFASMINGGRPVSNRQSVDTKPIIPKVGKTASETPALASSSRNRITTVKQEPPSDEYDPSSAGYGSSFQSTSSKRPAPVSGYIPTPIAKSSTDNGEENSTMHDNVHERASSSKSGNTFTPSSAGPRVTTVKSEPVEHKNYAGFTNSDDSDIIPLRVTNAKKTISRRLSSQTSQTSNERSSTSPGLNTQSAGTSNESNACPPVKHPEIVELSSDTDNEDSAMPQERMRPESRTVQRSQFSLKRVKKEPLGLHIRPGSPESPNPIPNDDVPSSEKTFFPFPPRNIKREWSPEPPRKDMRVRRSRNDGIDYKGDSKSEIEEDSAEHHDESNPIRSPGQQRHPRNSSKNSRRVSSSSETDEEESKRRERIRIQKDSIRKMMEKENREELREMRRKKRNSNKGTRQNDSSFDDEESEDYTEIFTFSRKKKMGEGRKDVYDKRNWKKMSSKDSDRSDNVPKTKETRSSTGRRRSHDKIQRKHMARSGKLRSRKESIDEDDIGSFIVSDDDDLWVKRKTKRGKVVDSSEEEYVPSDDEENIRNRRNITSNNTAKSNDGRKQSEAKKDRKKEREKKTDINRNIRERTVSPKMRRNEKEEMDKEQLRKNNEKFKKREQTREMERQRKLAFEISTHRSHWETEQNKRRKVNEKNIRSSIDSPDGSAPGSSSERKRKATSVDDESIARSSKKTITGEYDSSSSVPPKRLAHTAASGHGPPIPALPINRLKRPTNADVLAKTLKEAEERKRRAEKECEEKNKNKKYVTQEQLFGESKSRIGSSAKGEARQARPMGGDGLKRKLITIKKEITSSPESSKKKLLPNAPSVLEPGSQKVPLSFRIPIIKMIFNQLVENNADDPAKEAQKMEHELMRSSMTKNTYKVNCANATRRLRQNSDMGVISVSRNAVSHDQVLGGRNFSNVSVGINRKNAKSIDQLTPLELAQQIRGLMTNHDDLLTNGYPHFSSQFGRLTINPTEYDEKRLWKIWIQPGDMKRTCCRCNKKFELNENGSLPEQDCRYHNNGKTSMRRGGNWIKKHNCCGEEWNATPGCKISPQHVFEQTYVTELEKFRATPSPTGLNDSRSDKVYALDCEMVYTLEGSALARLSVVGLNGKLVLDVMVKPPTQVLDPNTEFSGLTMEQVMNAPDNLDSCREKLFSLVNSQTILVGHSLESDLKALRVVHLTVVDTALLFSSGGRKQSLKNLATQHLQRFIQSDNADTEGHDSYEDAKVCMDLVMHRLKNPALGAVHS